MDNLPNLGKVALLIEWADSRQPTNKWALLDNVAQHGFCRCYSVGFLIQEDKDVVVLAANVADVEEEAQATGVIVIPRVAVLKCTTLTSFLPPVSKQKRRQT
jgi:hypothetical protein